MEDKKGIVSRVKGVVAIQGPHICFDGGMTSPYLQNPSVQSYAHAEAPGTLMARLSTARLSVSRRLLEMLHTTCMGGREGGGSWPILTSCKSLEA